MTFIKIACKVSESIVQNNNLIRRELSFLSITKMIVLCLLSVVLLFVALIFFKRYDECHARYNRGYESEFVIAVLFSLAFCLSTGFAIADISRNWKLAKYKNLPASQILEKMHISNLNIMKILSIKNEVLAAAFSNLFSINDPNTSKITNALLIGLFDSLDFKSSIFDFKKSEAFFCDLISKIEDVITINNLNSKKAIKVILKDFYEYLNSSSGLRRNINAIINKIDQRYFLSCLFPNEDIDTACERVIEEFGLIKV